MTSLLIGYSDIPMRATGVMSYATSTTTETPDEEDDYQALNAYQGERFHWWKSSYTKSEHNIRWDLGPSSTKTASFIILSGLEYLRSLYPTTTIEFQLMRSSDDSSYTAEQTISSLNSLTLVGPWSNDYITTFTASSAYRYWRARILSTAGTSDFVSRIGKIYFGNLFDMGREPATYTIERDYQFASDFIASSGVKFTGRLSLPRYKISLEWHGISDTITKAFFDDIYSRRDTHTLFLYTSSFHDVLDSNRLIHVKLVDARAEDSFNIANYNKITAEFLEVLG